MKVVNTGSKNVWGKYTSKEILLDSKLELGQNEVAVQHCNVLLDWFFCIATV